MSSMYRCGVVNRLVEITGSVCVGRGGSMEWVEVVVREFPRNM
jgi:hypothetical protein